MIVQAKELRHPRRRPEVERIANPVGQEVRVELALYESQAGTDLAISARRLVVGAQQCAQPMRFDVQAGLLRRLFFRCLRHNRRHLRVSRFCRGIVGQHFGQQLARLLLVGMLDDLFGQPPFVIVQGLVGQHAGRDGAVVRLDADVRAAAARGAVEAVDLVATEAAVLPNDVDTFDQLRRRRIGETLARLQLRHVEMALQAAAFQEPLGPHREDPVVVAEPAVLVFPLVHFVRIVRRVRGPLEAGRTALPFVADRAAHVHHLVRAERADEQIQARMRAERMRQAAIHCSTESGLPQFHAVEQITINQSALVRHVDIVDVVQHVADLELSFGRRALAAVRR